MSRNVILHGGVNRITGDVEILEVHGGVANIMGRVGAVNQFGGVLNGKVFQQPPVKPTVKTEYRDRVVYRDRLVYKDRIVYRDREVSEDILVEKITRLENQLEYEREQHRQEVALLNERLQGALDAYHEVCQSAKCCQGTVPWQSSAEVQSPGSTWDDYKPTKAECEAVYKNMKVWLECEQELEPINL